MNRENNCHCPCGETSFNVSGSPIVRLFCHCTLCQKFNQAAYADVTAFYAKDVALPDGDKIDYQQYRRAPAVDRGKCKSCQQPTIERFNIPLVAKLVIIPTANIMDKVFVPEPKMHIFYDRRVSEIDDALPKYKGYLRSQLALMRKLI